MSGKRLCQRTLGVLPPNISVPTFDRSAVTPGIVHLGLGAFHRAHQAVFTDDCITAGETGWGIVAASLRNAETRDALRPQDGLYTLAVRTGDGEALRVIGSIGRILVAPEDPAALLSALVDPRIRIVTLTITEKGYAANLANGSLQPDHPDVAHDLANPQSPRSAIGYLAEALDRRRLAGAAPFTLLSCDNLPSNGATLHKILTEFASLRDPAFGRYVADTVASPSTMVDRIVPATTDPDRMSISARLGVEDAWPVVTDPFHRWVIEDRFPAGRPVWEGSGAEFVSDVAPFEQMKLRLLNGAHTVIAAIGQLTGLATVSDVVRQPVIRDFLQEYWTELIPAVSAHLHPADYARRLLARFDNAALGHRTAQIATDGSQKIPQRILAPLRELRSKGATTPCLVIAVAAWIRSCAGFDEEGRPLVLNDPLLRNWQDRPNQASASPAEIVRAFLGFAPVFGDDLVRAPDLGHALEAVLTSFGRAGVIRTLERAQYMKFQPGL